MKTDVWFYPVVPLEFSAHGSKFFAIALEMKKCFLSNQNIFFVIQPQKMMGLRFFLLILMSSIEPIKPILTKPLLSKEKKKNTVKKSILPTFCFVNSVWLKPKSFTWLKAKSFTMQMRNLNGIFRLILVSFRNTLLLCCLFIAFSVYQNLWTMEILQDWKLPKYLYIQLYTKPKGQLWWFHIIRICMIKFRYLSKENIKYVNPQKRPTGLRPTGLILSLRVQMRVLSEFGYFCLLFFERIAGLIRIRVLFESRSLSRI